MDTKKEDNLRYSEQDLREFEQIIIEKLSTAKKDLTYIKDSLTKKNDNGIEGTVSNSKLLEDGADTAEKEALNQQAARLQKFVSQLELALVRIKNGTYGVCIDTGVLIPKERLRLVPHTQHSVEAKKAKTR